MYIRLSFTEFLYYTRWNFLMYIKVLNKHICFTAEKRLLNFFKKIWVGLLTFGWNKKFWRSSFTFFFISSHLFRISLCIPVRRILTNGKKHISLVKLFFFYVSFFHFEFGIFAKHFLHHFSDTQTWSRFLAGVRLDQKIIWSLSSSENFQVTLKKFLV